MYVVYKRCISRYVPGMVRRCVFSFALFLSLKMRSTIIEMAVLLQYLYVSLKYLLIARLERKSLCENWQLRISYRKNLSSANLQFNHQLMNLENILIVVALQCAR